MANGAYSQENPCKTEGKYELKSYAVSYVSDGLRIPASPFRWKRQQWFVAAGTLVAGGIAYFNDEDIRQVFQNNENKNFDFVSENIGGNFGVFQYGLGGMGLISAFGAISGNENICRLGMTGFKAIVLTAATTQISKTLFHRQRPVDGLFPDSQKWHGPGFNRNNLSFFSNQTANAFTIACVISEFSDYDPWLSTGLYTLAGLTALSRIYTDEHWCSDIIIGAVVGYGIGKLCMNSTKWKARISPVYEVSSGNAGLHINILI
jgi:membrane-associated phospholipid phosphatase